MAPILHQQKGFRGVSASAGRAGAVLGILSLWETEADREASEGALSKARQEALGIVGGDLNVENFEEVVAEMKEPPVPGSALLVRRISMDPAKIDENLAFFKNEILPQIKASPGFRAVRNMINRQTGHGIVGSAWADEGAMRAAGAAAEARQSLGEARGVSFGELSYREILFADIR